MIRGYADINDCCQNRSIIYDSPTNEYICTQCGTVVGYSNDLYIDLESIQSNGANIKSIINSSRPSIDWSTLGINSSYINNRNVDYANKPVHWMVGNMLRTRDRMCVNKNDSNRQHHVKQAKQHIVSLSQKLFLPARIADRAARIYDIAYKAKLIKGRNIEGIAAACLYIACREEGLTKHLSDFSEIMFSKTVRKKIKKRVSTSDDLDEKYATNRSRRRIEKQLFEFYQLIVNNLNLKENIKEPSLDAEINRIGNIIRVTEESIRKAMTIAADLKKFDQTIFFGKPPSASATCILYIAINFTEEKIKQVVVTKKSGTSTVTLRKRCSEFCNLLAKNGYTIPKSLASFTIV